MIAPVADPIPVSPAKAVLSRVDGGHALIVGLLLVLFVANIVIQPSILDLVQIGLLVQSALPLVFVAAAQTLVVITRGLDLSLGGIVAVASALIATATDTESVSGVVIVVAVCTLLGIINGLLVTFGRFQPFVATLATWSVYNGVALWILPQDGGAVPLWVTTAVTSKFLGLPNSYWILAVLLVTWWYFHGLRLSRNIYAIGSDEERARLNGVKIYSTKIATYMIAGLLAGLAGVLLAGATATGQPTVGDGFILPSIAAVVIGGTALTGGRGGIGASVMGVLVLTLIATLVQALNLDTWVSVAASALLLLAVVVPRAINARRRGELV